MLCFDLQILQWTEYAIEWMDVCFNHTIRLLLFDNIKASLKVQGVGRKWEGQEVGGAIVMACRSRQGGMEMW